MRKIFTKPVVYTLYGLSVLFIFIGLVILSQTPQVAKMEDPDFSYNILDKFTFPVNSTKDMAIGRPYLDNNISIVQNFYDYKGKEEDQRNSLIYYKDTYIQSKGVSYSKGEESFDVIAILGGEVIEVKEDELIGNSITIKHSESVISIYQSVTDIKVAKGDTVTKGMLIAQSGTSNISPNLKKHLYFELIIDKNYVNPEGYYDKTL